VKKITEEWISKAEEDYLVAIRELRADPPALNAVCFHAQQCIEKYIKAILQENDIEFEKIHDLDILLQKSRSFISALGDYRDDLIKLSAYAVDVRYPGFEVSVAEAQECVASMEKIRQVMRSHFKIRS
jgi:HEPN domain-containing protein